MAKYDVVKLYPEKDLDLDNYKKWFIHLQPIDNVTSGDLYERFDTVAEIRIMIIDYEDDDRLTYESYVFFYPEHDQERCATIFKEFTSNKDKEYYASADEAAYIEALYNKCMAKLKEYLITVQ